MIILSPSTGTLYLLRHTIARTVEGRSFATGTVTVMSSNNIRSADLAMFPDDHFNDGQIYVYAGTAIGQAQRIHDFTQEAATPPTYGQVNPYIAFSPNAVTNDSFEIHAQNGWTVEQYNQAINQAFQAAEDLFLVDVIDDTSLTMVDSTYEYTIPAGFRYLSDVQVDQNKGVLPVRYESLLPTEWDVIPTSKTLLIAYPSDGYPLRLIGQGQATPPATDASTITLPERYVVAKATAEVLAMQPGGEARDPAERMRWAIYWAQIADKELAGLRVQVRPNSRNVERR